MLLEWSRGGRPIFADGVPDLRLDHQPLDVREWPSQVPDGALVVVDEVQRTWRAAGPGARIPDDIAALETHRHRGLDFILVTQHPKLLHTNVRALVGRHIHLRDVGVLGRWWYEWPECTDPATFRSAPLKRRYRLPKSVFSLYRSASEHVKPVRGVPPVVWVLGLALIGFAFVVWKLWGSVFERGGSAVALQSPASAVAAPFHAPAGVAARVSAGGASTSAAEIVSAFEPRIAGRPETAPAYDHLRVVVSMPRIVGGYCQGQRCYCQTQQGTRIHMPDAECRAWINSPSFDPYSAAPADEALAAPGASPGTAGAVAASPSS